MFSSNAHLLSAKKPERTRERRIVSLSSFCRLLIGVLIIFCSFGVLAEEVLRTQEHKVIDSGISYMIESSSLSTFEVHQSPDQDWVRFDGAINFGYTDEVHWFKIKLVNSSRSALPRLLAVSYPLLDTLSVYLFAANQLTHSYATGDVLPFDHRPIDHRYFLFPLEFESEQEHFLYLRVQTEGALQVPLALWDERSFFADDANVSAINFLYLGVLLIMAAFNFMLFLLIRDSSFIAYVFFVSCIGVLMASLFGYTYQYALSEYPRFHEILILLIVPLSQVSICVFTIRFLELPLHSKFWSRLLSSFIVIAMLSMIGAIILPYNLSTRISVILMLPIAVSAMAAGVSCWGHESSSARLYTIAWMSILIGAASSVLNRLGFIGNSFFVEYGLQMGTAVQTLLFSLALAARFNSERDARMKAQQEYVEEIHKRRNVETQLVYSASHHEITGMPNRLLFEKSIRHHFDSRNESDDHLLVVLLHIRRFDDVNKTLGHRNADVLLRRIGERINTVVTKSSDCLTIEEKKNDVSLVAHIEGVSFCFCLANTNKDEMLDEVESLVRRMAEPLEFMGLALELNFLVGCSFDGDEVDPQILLRQAFVAFDKADKRVSPIAVYEPTMNPYSPKRLTLMTELRTALEHDGLELHFQPQVHLSGKYVCGFEGLLRWTHHEFGVVPPDEFIPMAEKTGLMKPLTAWVIKRAAKFCRQLDELSCDAFVSVNISALNLREQSFSRQVCELLGEDSIAPSRLILEVTETAAMIDPDGALKVLNALHDANIRLSIDDFGTGHSSLSYIRRLPVQEIKIDRSFIGEMVNNKDDETIVRTTINMCHDLGFVVVAEGVEDQKTLELLETLNCDIVQGYHIARPSSVSNTVTWLLNSEWALRRPVELVRAQ